MAISIEKLRSFVTITEEGQFLRAAERLGITQPSLSARIRELEEDLRVRLFGRTTRQIQLTAEGERFLHRARQILSYIDLAVSEAHQQAALDHGRVVIAATPSIAGTIIPPAITQFAIQFPKIDVVVHEDIASAVDNLVRLGIADLGIGPLPERSSDLEFIPLFEERFLAILPRNHVLSSKKTVSLQQLAKHPFVTLPQGAGIRDVIDRALQDSDTTVEIQHVLTQRETILAFVEAGLGISLMPEISLYQERFRNIDVVPVDGHIARPIGVIRQKGGGTSAASKTFVDLIIASALWKDMLYQPR